LVAASDRPRILVVDGDEQTLAGFRRVLQHAYDLVATTNWEHALELLGRSDFAVVIAGDNLPWLGGVEFLQRAWAAQPHTCRILLGTGTKSDCLISAINNARVHYFLSRPWQGAAFKEIIAQEVRLATEERRLVWEHRQYKRLLADGRSGLRCRPLAMEGAEKALREAGFLGVLCIDASKLMAQEVTLTKSDFAALTERFNQLAGKLAGSLLRREDVVAIDEVNGPRSFVFVAPPRDGRVALLDDSRRAAARLQQEITASLSRLAVGRLVRPAVTVGAGFTLYDPRLALSFQVQQVVETARQTALTPEHPKDAPSRLVELETILAERRIHSLYQPIFSLSGGAVLGYEALSRGPAGSPYENPEFLLSSAEEAGLTFEVDRLFRSMALTNAVELPRDKKIFINTLASTAHDPELASDRLSRFLRQLDIPPSRVVFEFSERCNIAHHDVLVETLQHYRALGVQVAIDDVGAGYSGLERIVSLKPDYLKIDRSLIQDIHCLPVKRSVLTALVSLASSLDAEVIAEGIEQSADVDCLTELGVHYGQGYLLGRPAHPAPRGWSAPGAFTARAS
jgi:EAL domain-containing protein (putative c-di-GMP-specific phosphodiesterase class I)/DNA-binding response OmpR family regulator